MTKLEIVVPDILVRFKSEKREEVLLGAIRHVALAKLKEEKKGLKEAMGHIKRYEKKYKMAFSEFEKQMPPGGDVETHEDYVDWSFWVDVYGKTKDDVEKLETLSSGEV